MQPQNVAVCSYKPSASTYQFMGSNIPQRWNHQQHSCLAAQHLVGLRMTLLHYITSNSGQQTQAKPHTHNSINVH